MGRLHGSDIHAPNGRYIGEVMGNGRLVTNKAKVANLWVTFTPSAPREGFDPRPAEEGLTLYAGFRDFPDPAEL